MKYDKTRKRRCNSSFNKTINFRGQPTPLKKSKKNREEKWGLNATVALVVQFGILSSDLALTIFLERQIHFYASLHIYFI